MTNRILVAAALLCAAGTAVAQEKGGPSHGGTELNQALRDAINLGANLYNRFGDHAGCYRVYQGTLITLKPFLPAELQKKVDATLERAEKLGNFSDRAFELRAMIDEVRDWTKAGVRPSPDTQTVEKKTTKTEKRTGEPPLAPKVVDKTEKKSSETKREETPAPKIEEKTKAASEAGTLETKGTQRVQLSGLVTYEGKPLAPGFFLGVVSVDGERRYTAQVKKGGAFQFSNTLPAGQYRIQFETFLEKEAPANLPSLPERYRSADKSGLVVDLRPGTQHLDVNLVK
jgi:hypothetical protein